MKIKILLWSLVGLGVYAIGGPTLFIAWLTPGVPPPGPFG